MAQERKPRFALDDAEYKEYKALLSKMKAKTLTEEDKKRLAELVTKKRNSSTVKQDISWYVKFPELIQAAANIAWNQYPGHRIPYENAGNSSDPTAIEIIPNVMCMEYLATVGESLNSDSAINTISRIQFLQMHRKYRNMGSYEQSDLGITMFVLVNIFTMIAWAERMYGVHNHYNVLNKAVPEVMLEALHIDGTTWDPVLADFRYRLNRRIKKVSSVCLPKGLTVLERQIIMNTLLFKDSNENIKNPSIYCFSPYGYYTFDGTFATGTSAPLTVLMSKATGTTPSGAYGFTPDDVIGIIDDQLSSILDNADVARICSDILAAYTRKDAAGYEDTSDLVFLNAMPEDYQVTPVYSEEWLLQIHNADIGDFQFRSGQYYLPHIGSVSNPGIPMFSNGEVKIYQQNNVIINRLVFWFGTFNVYENDVDSSLVPVGTLTTAPNYRISDAFIDTWKAHPTTDDNVEYTRLKCPVAKYVPDSYFVTYPCAGYGTEIILYAFMYGKVAGQSTQIVPVSGDPGNPNLTRCLSWLSAFDWHPAVYSLLANNNTTNRLEYDAVGRFWDIDNMVKVPNITLERLHDACVLSEFTFPLVESFLKNQ